MKSISNFCDAILSRVQEDWRLKLRAEWSTIMGDLSQRARLERINDSVIVIGVYDSHWMHELHALSRMILYRINSALMPLYPSGFTLTCVRCIWASKKDIHTVRRPVPSVILKKERKPTRAILQKVASLPTVDLQDALLAYYSRCRQENNEQ